MVSDKFRHQIRQEAEKWLAEGLIDVQLYEQLASRYRFSELDLAARNRFVMILLGFGSILLGLAVITFVAANWQVWSRELKVILLMSLWIGVNSLGFYFWRNSQVGWRSRLGTALLLLGALVLGANLGLMSQMFHQSGPVYQLYLIWALGVLAMAYGLESTSLGILAVILTGIGYFTGVFRSYTYESNLFFEIVLLNIPIIATLIYIPLARKYNSPLLFALSAILIVYASAINLSHKTGFSSEITGLLKASIFCFPSALLWAYRDSLWGRYFANTASFEKIAHNLAIFCLSFLWYFFSFKFFNRDSFFNSGSAKNLTWQSLLALVNIVFFLVLTLWAWWRLGYANGGNRWRLELNSTLIGSGLTVTAALIWWQVSVDNLGAIAIFIVNLLLFLLAVVLIRQALKQGRRLGFWWGIFLLVLQLFSRMLEYDTGLLFKAIVLFICGVTVIAAGLWFERYVRTLNPSRQ